MLILIFCAFPAPDRHMPSSLLVNRTYRSRICSSLSGIRTTENDLMSFHPKRRRVLLRRADLAMKDRLSEKFKYMHRRAPWIRQILNQPPLPIVLKTRSETGQIFLRFMTGRHLFRWTSARTLWRERFCDTRHQTHNRSVEKYRTFSRPSLFRDPGKSCR